MNKQKTEQENTTVGISIGDINGIGPEILINGLNDKRMLEDRTFIVYAHPEILRHYTKVLGNETFNYNSISKAEEALPKRVNVLKLELGEINIETGRATREAGKIALNSLESATSDLASGKIDVLVTLPINKDTIQSSEFNFPGHTEYLANMSNVEDHLMLLTEENLRVGVVTGHIPIKDVASSITKEAILKKLDILNSSLIKDFGLSRPKIAVLGLNPHAGDNGLLGKEENEIISPAIKAAQENGMLVFGPFGADGFFGTLNYKNFDGVLAMYHDQGLIPFKTLAFERGVNFTAGLPIVRTSPDHGTAYEIAGENKSDESSFRHAVHLAVDIYNQRKSHRELTENSLEINTDPKKSEK